MSYPLTLTEAMKRYKERHLRSIFSPVNNIEAAEYFEAIAKDGGCVLYSVEQLKAMAKEMRLNARSDQFYGC